MPTVPRYTSRVAPTPLPGARVTSSGSAAGGPDAYGAAVGEAQARFGATVAQVGAQALDQVLQIRRDRADQAAILGAQRQLDALEHALLNDPTTGAYTVKGKDTLGLYDTVTAAYDTAAGDIESGLSSDRQRMAFADARDNRRRAIVSTLDGYTLREVDGYETGEAKASIESAVNMAIANAGNAGRVAEELRRVDALVDQYGPRLGLTGPAAKGEALTAARTKVHQGVIASLLAQDRDQDASAYFDAVVAGYGPRADGSVKGEGFFGALARPDGRVSSELSIGVDSEDLGQAPGTEVEIPTMVPTLTHDEVDALLHLPDGVGVPKAIADKAVQFARDRVAQGLSPFAQPGEQATTYPDLARRYGQEIDASAVPPLRAQVDNASTEGTAFRLADQVWKELAPTGDQAAIPFDLMDARARTLADGNPKIYKAAMTYLHERYADTVTGRKERLDARDDTVWTAVLQGTPFAQLRTSPAFLALEGKDQAAVRDYYTREIEHQANVAYLNESRANAREGQQYTKQLREAKQLELDHWSDYYDLSNPATLRSMSRADILRKVPTIGIEHVNRLLQDQEQLARTDVALKTATIDHDEFISIATDAGVTYAAAPKTPLEKATLAQIEDRVKDEIARQQAGANRLLTRAEKQTLMQGMVDQKVRLNQWGFDPETFGASVPITGRAGAYVPLGDIDARPQVYGRAYAQALNYLRGLTGNAALTDTQLRAQFGSRIEKAIGRSLSGATPAEIEGALKGIN